MYDREHQDNALNTHRGGGKIWRATVWEIHPVTAMRVLPVPPVPLP